MTVKDKTFFKEIIVPDLERELLGYVPTGWSDHEIVVVNRYYNRVPLPALMKHLPGKTKNAVQCMASKLGVTGKREPIKK